MTYRSEYAKSTTILTPSFEDFANLFKSVYVNAQKVVGLNFLSYARNL